MSWQRSGTKGRLCSRDRILLCFQVEIILSSATSLSPFPVKQMVAEPINSSATEEIETRRRGIFLVCGGLVTNVQIEGSSESELEISGSSLKVD